LDDFVLADAPPSAPACRTWRAHSLRRAFAQKNAFNVALLPEIHGDAQDLRHVIDKMNREITELRRRDADTFFS